MAKALLGHVGVSTDLRLAAEVRRLLDDAGVPYSQGAEF